MWLIFHNVLTKRRFSTVRVLQSGATNMRLSTHLRRSRNGGFEVRIVVPENLRAQIGKANLTRRLGRLTKTDANRVAARVIDEFFGLIDAARSGNALASTLSSAPSAVPVKVVSPVQVTDLFDGYLRERLPSAATVKRWRPVFDSLVRHVGHSDAARVSVEHIIRWKEALLAEGVIAISSGNSA